jgi:hypothetical protein
MPNILQKATLDLLPLVRIFPPEFIGQHFTMRMWNYFIVFSMENNNGTTDEGYFFNGRINIVLRRIEVLFVV